MKKLLSIVVMMFSIVGVRPLFAQTAKSISFRISNIPNKQGNVLLATANGKHYGMAEASDSVVTICLNEFPLGKQAIYVFHDANGNFKMDMSDGKLPIEFCAVQNVQITEDDQTFEIKLVDVRKKHANNNQPINH